MEEIQTRSELLSKQNRMEVHRTSVKLAGDDLFGRVISGSIRLRGKVKTGVVDRVPNGMYAPSWLYVKDPISGERIGHYFPDDPPWHLYSKEAAAACDVVDAPGAADDINESSKFKTQVGNANKPTQTSSLALLQAIKCVCIDYFPHNVKGWSAIAIEELSQEDGAKSSDSDEAVDKRYRRIGLVGYPARLHWFEDGPWELIELI